MSHWIFFLFIYSPWTDIGAAHDFHLSRCEINYDVKSGDLQVAAHIFIDDLEKAILETSKKDLFLATSKEKAESEAEIFKYIHQKLIMRVGGKTIPLTWIGKEVSDDKIALWCYLEAQNVRIKPSLLLENKILTELYQDQKNIVDFTVDKKKTHFAIFDYKNFQEDFPF